MLLRREYRRGSTYKNEKRKGGNTPKREKIEK